MIGGKKSDASWMPGVASEDDADFSKVHDTMTELIKQVANEPSVGLYFVQHHVHKAIPVLVSLKSQLVESTREAVFSTEDAKDAITSVKTMKECGQSTIERMMKTLSSAASMLPSLRRGDSSTGHLPGMAADEHHLEHASKRRSESVPVLESSDVAGSTSSAGSRGVPRLIDPMMMNGYVWTLYDSAVSRASSVTSGVRRLTEGKAGEETEPSPVAGTNDAEPSTSSGYRAPQTPLTYTVPGSYMRAVYDTAVQTAGTVGREVWRIGSRSSRESEHEPFQTLPDLPSSPHSAAPNEQAHGVEEESFEQFQADQAAQFEAWLGETHTAH